MAAANATLFIFCLNYNSNVHLYELEILHVIYLSCQPLLTCDIYLF